MSNGRMRKWLIACVVPLLILLLLAFVWLRSGPRAAVPTVDPIVRWNAEHAQIEDNAADLYRAAFERLVGKEDSSWWGRHRRPSDPVPPEAAAWVEQNQDALELARQAAQRRDCWFVLERDPNGDLNLSHLAPMRTIGKLLYWQAAVAADRHDAFVLADTAVTASCIARHLDQGSLGLVNALMPIAFRSVACNELTQPMLWPELSTVERADYLSRISSIFEPPPALSDALCGEQELSSWMYASGSFAVPFAASDRVAGELEQRFRPLRELAAAPVERQCDPADPLVGRVRAMEREQVSKLNFAGMYASWQIPGATRALDVRVRLVTDLRGARTVLELFTYRDRRGAWPESLEALPGDFKIDPFSGKPFVYRRTDDGFTLYSVGFDRKDNGGRHDRRMGEGRTDSDYVFWPIPEPQATSAPASQPGQGSE